MESERSPQVSNQFFVYFKLFPLVVGFIGIEEGHRVEGHILFPELRGEAEVGRFSRDLGERVRVSEVRWWRFG